MAWCSDCLCMCCCGPCALERRYGDDTNCGCKLSPWTIFHVLCTDASTLLSYGYWIARQEKLHTEVKGGKIVSKIERVKPSKVSCSKLCCVPCLYASERQRHLHKKNQEQQQSTVELATFNNNNENNENDKDLKTKQKSPLSNPVTDQPQTQLLLKL